MISFNQQGDLSKTISFLNGLKNNNISSVLNKYGEQGVNALAKATPTDTGETANSWNYRIESKKGKASIIWYNTNVVNGAPIAVLIQYGHGTQNGGYIQGRDYINPAMRPVFDRIANDVWKEVTK